MWKAIFTPFTFWKISLSKVNFVPLLILYVTCPAWSLLLSYWRKIFKADNICQYWFTSGFSFFRILFIDIWISVVCFVGPALVQKRFVFVVVTVFAACIIRIFVLIRIWNVGTFWIILGKVFLDLCHIFYFDYIIRDVFTKNILWIVELLYEQEQHARKFLYKSLLK